jgi:dCTP deaminase
LEWRTGVELLFQHVDYEPGKGILPSQEIKEFVRLGRIRSPLEIGASQIQPASIDLRLGPEALRVQASFLPGQSSTLLTKAKGLLVNRVDLTHPDGALLEPNVVYVVPLTESLALPPDVRGLANPKSTTGRLDIFTRLITESGEEFDRVPKGYSGELYVEVVSRTFPVRIRKGMTLNQLRFVRGNPAPTGDARLRELAKENLRLADEEEAGQADINRGWPITVDLQGNGSDIVAYKARKHTRPVELDRINHYDPSEFWEVISRPASGYIILEPGGFYILASKRKVRVPPDHAAEMVPYDPAMGEFRVHYAGFFDPGFGYGTQGEIAGTRAVLEVRAYEMPILLEHDQLVGRLLYYKMAGTPERVYGAGIGSSYQQQGLALAKQFKRPVSTSSTTVTESPTPPLVQAQLAG